jgi:adhesin/invasin
VALIDTVLPNFPVNSFVSPLPSVRVVDANGNPVAGAEVTFVEDAGTTSTLTGAVKVTGADGIATLTSWRIGTAATLYRLRAIVTGLNQNGQEPTFVVTGTASNPVALQALSSQALTGQGNNQNTTQAPTVRVVDQFGNPVAGVTVTFTIPGAPAATMYSPPQTTPLSIITGANGVASVGVWTIGAGAGQRSLTASISTIAGTVSIVFTADP